MHGGFGISASPRRRLLCYRELARHKGMALDRQKEVCFYLPGTTGRLGTECQKNGRHCRTPYGEPLLWGPLRDNRKGSSLGGMSNLSVRPGIVLGVGGKGLQPGRSQCEAVVKSSWSRG